VKAYNNSGGELVFKFLLVQLSCFNDVDRVPEAIVQATNALNICNNNQKLANKTKNNQSIDQTGRHLDYAGHTLLNQPA
jgi:hypothetical protein